MKQIIKRTEHINRDGYTLIELMMSIVIIGMVMIVSFAFWRYFSESFDFTFGKSVSVSDAYRATSIIVRELREVRYGDEGSYPLNITNDQELAFFADVDEDGEAEEEGVEEVFHI